MVELHSNIAARGTTHETEGVLPTQAALHETLEITHGWVPWFETGFYLFTSLQPDGWQWVGDHVRPRVRVPEDWHWPVGVSLSAEFGYQQRRFSTDTWTLEIRPIVDQQLGRWYWSLNPSLDRSFEGLTEKRGFEFAPNFKVSYDLTQVVSAGFEYYGSLGPLSGFDRVDQQQHQIFPVVDLNLGPRWEFNFGIGFGLTRSTDPLIVKLILGYRFSGPAGGSGGYR
jgi:outer membrane putative beta-barrel porin/alpha-amylase